MTWSLAEIGTKQGGSFTWTYTPTLATFYTLKHAEYEAENVHCKSGVRNGIHSMPTASPAVIQVAGSIISPQLSNVPHYV